MISLIPMRWFLVLFLSFWPLAAVSSEEIKKTSLDLPAPLEPFLYVRVLIDDQMFQSEIQSDVPFRLLDESSNVLFSGASLPPTLVRAVAGGIQFGRQVFNSPSLFLHTQGGSVKVGDKTYRHHIDFRKADTGRLMVINEIYIEDYLKGVLPTEVNPKWPMEALKTQAVASRTYALFKNIEHADKPYTLNKDVLSQVYGGKAVEHVRSTEAVELTKGQILTYRGKIFPAYFHSTCGGHTTHAEYVWPVEKHDSLLGVRCGFCQGSKNYRWSTDFTREEIEQKLKKQGVAASGILAIRPIDVDESGRAKRISVENAQKRFKIHAANFRLWMDPGKFKSVKELTVQPIPGGFRFTGKGWGHGVGMCQYGMEHLAQLGYNYQDILRYYYPDSSMKYLGFE